MNRTTLALLTLAALSSAASAQHYDMTRWGADRGYTEAPYARYEAEPDFCSGYTGTLLPQSDIQTDLQSEASNQQAITLGNGQYVSWLNGSGNADGLTLRFSVPWGAQAAIGVFAGDELLGELSLNTDHSWEFCEKIKGNRHNKPEYYSIHVFNANESVRMRFDEVHKLLSREIRQGETFTLRNLSSTPVTIDFVEIEKARKVEYQDGWVRWNQTIDPDLQNFINNNQGRTIYIDQAYTGVWGKLSLGSAHLQGRGIFYTELHWEQNGAGFNDFGTSVRDMSLTSYQNQRYSSSDHGPNGYGSPGKCFNGNMSGATVEYVLVEHFECGGWLSGTNGATFRHCRFRNNYADGINFCNSSNCLMEQSSFRNNGDDDMASWSAESYCSNNTFRHCTAEHNWRASSLGFFGGGGHRAENILIKDGLESGARLVSDFSGPAFGSEGIDFANISIVHCACIEGEVGVHGDFWGVDEGALHIEASSHYSLVNGRFRNIDIFDSRGNAVFIGANPGNSHSINGVTIDNINIHGVRDDASYAVYFENPRGSVTINGIDIDGASNITNLPGGALAGYSDGTFTLATTGFDAKPIEPIAGCTLTLSGLAWERATRDASPITAGDRVTFSIRIDNTGTADLPPDYPLAAALTFDDGSSVSLSHTAGITAGQFAILSGQWTATEGGRTVAATLDPSNRLGDMTSASPIIYKKFNVGKATYTFTTTSGIDFQVLDLLWKVVGRDSEPGKGSIDVGDPVLFTAVIANTGTENSGTTEKLGVTFRRNGMEYAAGAPGYYWCDKDESYATFPAQSIKYFEAKGGASDTDIWTASTGTNSFLMEVNDSKDRPESNTGNNTLTVPLSIPYTAAASNFHPLTEVSTPDDLYSGPTTAIPVLSDDPMAQDDTWVTLTGVRLNGRPTVPGLYIHAGKKAYIRQ